jgi:hypothetical protein
MRRWGRPGQRGAITMTVAAGLLLAGCGSESEEDPARAVEEAPGGSASAIQAGVGEEPEGDTRDDIQREFDERAEQVIEDWPGTSPAGQNDLVFVSDVQSVGRIDAADQGLRMTVGHGACDTAVGTLVRETEDLVIVGSWSETAPDMMCTEQLLTTDMNVSLDGRLGERTVVDAATGLDVTSEEFTERYQ